MPHDPYRSARRIVVVGGSAGGVEAAIAFVEALPRDLPAAVVIAIHRNDVSFLKEILGRRTDMRVRRAADGDALRTGVIYVAPGGAHVTIGDGVVNVFPPERSDKRLPSIDNLFATAAEHYGAGVIAVVLSGALDDGAEGAVRIAEHGGTTVVQSPDEARQPSMPLSALLRDSPAATLPASALADRVVEMVFAEVGALG